jgi:hypothetical protein
MASRRTRIWLEHAPAVPVTAAGVAPGVRDDVMGLADVANEQSTQQVLRPAPALESFVAVGSNARAGLCPLIQLIWNNPQGFVPMLDPFRLRTPTPLVLATAGWMGRAESVGSNSPAPPGPTFTTGSVSTRRNPATNTIASRKILASPIGYRGRRRGAETGYVAGSSRSTQMLGLSIGQKFDDYRNQTYSSCPLRSYEHEMPSVRGRGTRT